MYNASSAYEAATNEDRPETKTVPPPSSLAYSSDLLAHSAMYTPYPNMVPVLFPICFSWEPVFRMLIAQEGLVP